MADRELITLNEVTPQLEAAQTGDRYSVPRDMVFLDGVTITSDETDGATAVAFAFDTDNAYSTSGAKLASFSNNGVEKAFITKDGIGAFTASGSVDCNLYVGPNGSFIANGTLNNGDSSNVFIGYRAGDQAGGGAADNVVIGTACSRYIGGDRNVALGYNIGTYPSGGDNILIGADTGMGTATHSGCVALGAYSRADQYQGFAMAGQTFAADGDNQFLVWQPAATTTDATPSILYLDEDAATQRMSVASGKLYAFEAHIVGVQSDGTDAAYYVRRGIIANNSGTTALIGSVQTIGTDIESNASTDVSVTADDTNDALHIQVTGIAAETWRWSANVFVKDITIGT